MKDDKFYVRATGQNRWAGGSCRWLLVRGIKKENGGYSIKVKTKWGIKYISISDISDDGTTPNLVLRKGYKWSNRYPRKFTDIL